MPHTAMPSWYIGSEFSADVVVEQAPLQLVDRLSGYKSDFFEMNPDQNGAGDMIALDASDAALAGVNTCDLLGFAMKMLDGQTQGTHVSFALGGVLLKVVSGDIVRALGGEQQSEEFHAMTLWKVFDINGFVSVSLVWLLSKNWH